MTTPSELFKQCFGRVMKAEGGYKLTNIKNYAGGKTYAGISKRAHPDWEGWEIIDSNPDDLQNEQLHQLVADVYYNEYWLRSVTKNGLDKTQFAPLASTVFSMSVNMGHGAAVTLLGKALECEVTAIRDKVAILQENRVAGVVEAFKAAALERYKAIVEKTPANKKFLAGWINRVKES